MKTVLQRILGVLFLGSLFLLSLPLMIVLFSTLMVASLAGWLYARLAMNRMARFQAEHTGQDDGVIVDGEYVIIAR